MRGWNFGRVETCTRMSRPAFRASRPPIQWYLKLFFTSKTAGAWGWPTISISCWGWEWVEPQLHLFDFVVCTGTTLPFVYKVFMLVVQMSCYRSKSAPDRNQVLKFNPYFTGKKKKSVTMLISLMDFLENWLGTCLLGVRIALSVIL